MIMLTMQVWMYVCAYIYIHAHSSTIAVRFFSYRDMYTFVQSFITRFSFFFLLHSVVSFLMLTRRTTRRQMSSKIACRDGNVI